MIAGFEDLLNIALSSPPHSEVHWILTRFRRWIHLPLRLWLARLYWTLLTRPAPGREARSWFCRVPGLRFPQQRPIQICDGEAPKEPLGVI